MIKIVIVAIIFAVIILFLKNIKSELTILVEIISGIILLSLAFGYLNETFEFFNNLIKLTGLDSEIFIIVLKVTAIGYLIEFGAGTIEDFGLTSLAGKLVFIGKLVIVGISLPIIYAIFNLVTGLLG